MKFNYKIFFLGIIIYAFILIMSIVLFGDKVTYFVLGVPFFTIPILFLLMIYMTIKKFISKRRIAQPKIEKKKFIVKEIKPQPKETEAILQRIENYKRIRKQRIVLVLLGIFLIAIVIFLYKTQIEKPSYPIYRPPSYEQPSVSTREPFCGNHFCDYMENGETYRTCPTDCPIKIYENEIYGKYVTYDCPDEIIPLCKELQKRSNDIVYPFLKELMSIDFDSNYCYNKVKSQNIPYQSILPIVVHATDIDNEAIPHPFTVDNPAAAIMEGGVGNEIFIFSKYLVPRQVEVDNELTGEVWEWKLSEFATDIHEMIHLFDKCANTGVHIEIVPEVIEIHILRKLYSHYIYETQSYNQWIVIEDIMNIWKEEISGNFSGWHSQTRKHLSGWHTQMEENNWNPSEKELSVSYQFIDLGFFDEEFLKNYYSLLKQYPNSRSWEDLANFIYQASGRREDIKEFFKEHGFSETDFT